MANTDLLWNAQSMLTPLTIPTRFQQDNFRLMVSMMPIHLM